MHRKQALESSYESKEQHRYAETDPTGRYGRFDEVLGKGATKTVYKGIDEMLGIEVAWNQVRLNQVLQSPDHLQRLYSEVHLLGTLKNDAIIRFYASWIDVQNRTFNFITEMFTSGTLREYRKKYNRVHIGAIKSWARQILQGLVYLHNHDPPVIHRDLKCDNIFINGHLGQVKIGDLGLAAILRGSKTAHSVIGTPEFMAPELYEEDYNELVDVYSFGMCVLEMLTSQYPYSECSNPAQIYKKVTSGKLPAAFYRIEDLEAQRFMGKCFTHASKRVSARELLLDPFLANDEAEISYISRFGNQKPFINLKEMEKLQLKDDPQRTEMTITGKPNPEDDTIFLKVQIANKDGSLRNIFFPFDILHDTPINVAVEMVKDLEIDDWEASEIAEMIDGEISALAPNWKRLELPHTNAYHTFDYQEDDEHNHPFHSPSSASKTSQTDFTTYWPQDDLFDDTSSQSSSHSRSYPNMNYISGDDHKSNMSLTRRDKHQNLTRLHRQFDSNSYNDSAIAQKAYYHCRLLLDRASSSKNNRAVVDSRILMRNRSLVDARSQLLHRSLVEEVNKRRLSKTVGAMEEVGFQGPPRDSKKASHLKSSRRK